MKCLVVSPRHADHVSPSQLPAYKGQRGNRAGSRGVGLFILLPGTKIGPESPVVNYRPYLSDFLDCLWSGNDQ